MNTRIDINPALTLPCQNCNANTPKLPKFGWEPGFIFAPEWHQWFAEFQLARKNGTKTPPPPETDHYMPCPDCDGKGERNANVEEFMEYHLTSFQLELFKTHGIKFVKEGST